MMSDVMEKVLDQKLGEQEHLTAVELTDKELEKIHGACGGLGGFGGFGGFGGVALNQAAIASPCFGGVALNQAAIA